MRQPPVIALASGWNNATIIGGSAHCWNTLY